MDSEFCCNCYSTRLAKESNLTTKPHPKPYKLHWLNEDGDITIKRQVKVEFSIKKYIDEVLCDIISMDACHIFLSRPWKFDRKTIHKYLYNEITILYEENKFVLHPLSASQMVENQVQMKINRDG